MKQADRPTLRVLGIRGIPAAHGGFETFAENLCLYLSAKGWRVIVYCQEEGNGATRTDTWRGVERVVIPVKSSGVMSSVVFDWLSITHATNTKDLCLTLGYNTALFCSRLKIRGIPNIINMDGIEWSRAKWGIVAKTWFWLNDWAGCWLGDHLIADHPEIKKHLMTRVSADKITTIAYGADPIIEASEDPVRQLGLEPGRYLTVIARPEPENSILEVIEGYVAKQRDVELVVLGNYDQTNPYHQRVLDAGKDRVRFVGAIYNKDVVHSLRCHSLAYVHGHQVGGTNPSLVEALGASNAVLAHDNRFNRWVAGDAAAYFSGAAEFDRILTRLLANRQELTRMSRESNKRFVENFTWPQILHEYEQTILKHLPSSQVSLSSPTA